MVRGYELVWELEQRSRSDQCVIAVPISTDLRPRHFRVVAGQGCSNRESRESRGAKKVAIRAESRGAQYLLQRWVRTQPCTQFFLDTFGHEKTLMAGNDVDQEIGPHGRFDIPRSTTYSFSDITFAIWHRCHVIPPISTISLSTVGITPAFFAYP